MDRSVETSLSKLLLAGDRLRAALAARHGLTFVEASALSHLDLAGPLTQRNLGLRVGLSTGAVTGLVDRLERHGVCRREPHPSDRRSSFVTLTDRGREVVADAAVEVQHVGQVVPGDQQPEFLRGVDAVAGAMLDLLDQLPPLRTAQAS